MRLRDVAELQQIRAKAATGKHLGMRDLSIIDTVVADMLYDAGYVAGLTYAVHVRSVGGLEYDFVPGMTPREGFKCENDYDAKQP